MLEIVTGGDEAYRHGIAVALRSAVRHVSRPVALTILDLGLASETLESLCNAARDWPNVASVQCVTPQLAEFSDLPTPAHFTAANYARLRLPDLMSGDRALWVDADVLVRADLSPLWDLISADDAPAAAALDFRHPTLRTAIPALRGAREDTPHYNSGVLAMNLELWRERRLTDATLDWLRANPSLVRYVDQDAINAVMADDIKMLDARWNVQTGPLHGLSRNPDDPRHAVMRLDVQAVARGARIVHFVDGKPWDGRGLQANRLSASATFAWWRMLAEAGVLERRRVARLAVRAACASVPYLMRAAATGRVARALSSSASVLRSFRVRR